MAEVYFSTLKMRQVIITAFILKTPSPPPPNGLNKTAITDLFAKDYLTVLSSEFVFSTTESEIKHF